MKYIHELRVKEKTYRRGVVDIGKYKSRVRENVRIKRIANQPVLQIICGIYRLNVICKKTSTIIALNTN